MKKTTVLTLILLFLFVGGFAFFLSYEAKTFFNDESTQGNTSANLMNDGLFCQEGDKIYFSNERDKGSLYVTDSNLTQYEKVANDTVANINVAGKYIYYSRLNYKENKKTLNLLNFNSEGLYRINKNGTKIKQLFDAKTGLVNLYGNYIYYQYLDKNSQMQLYKVKIDNSENIKITDEAISPVSIIENTLYYSSVNNNHNIQSLNLSSNNVTTVLEENTFNTIVDHNYIYYLSLSNDYALTRANLDGSNPTILVNERCFTFNLSPSGKYLYYQVDDAKNNRLCKLDLQTMESKTLLIGNYKQINVTSNYVFFKEFESDQTFYLSIYDDTVNVFKPPIIFNNK